MEHIKYLPIYMEHIKYLYNHLRYFLYLQKIYFNIYLFICDTLNVYIITYDIFYIYKKYILIFTYLHNHLRYFLYLQKIYFILYLQNIFIYNYLIFKLSKNFLIILNTSHH